jgi:predicted O-methyltransferase YrrM
MVFDTSKVKGHEKISSLQLFNKFLFNDDSRDYEVALYEYIVGQTKLSFSADEFSTSTKHTPEEMASSPVALSLLRFLVYVTKPSLVVEIGTFIGFTTANLAACLGPGSKIVTFEKFNEFAEIAQKNMKELKVEDKVEIVKGDAKATLSQRNLSDVDLVFIDGNKEDYLTYFKYFENRLSKNGIIIIDDCFFHGDVLNASQMSEKGRGVKDIMDYVSASEEFVTTILPISNGMTLVCRKN